MRDTAKRRYHQHKRRHLKARAASDVPNMSYANTAWWQTRLLNALEEHYPRGTHTSTGFTASRGSRVIIHNKDELVRIDLWMPDRREGTWRLKRKGLKPNAFERGLYPD